MNTPVVMERAHSHMVPQPALYGQTLMPMTDRNGSGHQHEGGNYSPRQTEEIKDDTVEPQKHINLYRYHTRSTGKIIKNAAPSGVVLEIQKDFETDFSDFNERLESNREEFINGNGGLEDDANFFDYQLNKFQDSNKEFPDSPKQMSSNRDRAKFNFQSPKEEQEDRDPSNIRESKQPEQPEK